MDIFHVYPLLFLLVLNVFTFVPLLIEFLLADIIIYKKSVTKLMKSRAEQQMYTNIINGSPNN